MGVFVPSVSLGEADFGIFTLTGAQQLFFLGGIAIAAGILTYSKKVMQTVGNNLLELTSRGRPGGSAVTGTGAVYFFIFGAVRPGCSDGLPPIPLVPVSSTQVVVGASPGCRPLQGGQEH